MAGVIWSPRARLAFERRVAEIARKASVRTALKWAGRIRSAVAVLGSMPELGSPVEDVPLPGYREQIVGPYRIIYRYDGADCHIVLIARAEQDLGRLLGPEDRG